MDYLIFGNHNCYFKGKKEHFLKYISKKNYLRRYVTKSIKALRSGLFKIRAHPDIFMSGLKWDKDCEKVAKIICKEAKIKNAINIYSELIRKNPSNIEYIIALTNIYVIKRDFIKSRKVLQQFFKANPHQRGNSRLDSYGILKLCL